MKKTIQIICIGCIATIIISCGNSGKQANSSEGTKQEAAPQAPTKAYREIAVEFVSEAIALKQISLYIFLDYGVNWELMEKGEKVYDEKNELTRFHIEDMVLDQRQKFYESNNTFQTISKMLGDMGEKAKSLQGLKNDTQISQADLDLIGTKSMLFIDFVYKQAQRPTLKRSDFLVKGMEMYKEIEAAINQTGEIAQEAAPKMGSIYNESLTSSVKQYWESFLIPYLNQNQ
ncbi:hypothetical protein [Prevotella sp. tf2-5]|uniref:hypothetical protein n=1 Tax=Prevotella sp. tf2-5 TaxID=1761889 RepID=UPI0008EF1376|nr:hypothetical protein [Prevotella sp. tf2-5]SFO98984.1 hypothetical protein SAMN04487852_11228 [Prevotella sp. tf2-5]